MITKQCTGCKETKELSLFNRSLYGRLGYTSRCKVCEKKRLYEWRYKTKERKTQGAFA